MRSFAHRWIGLGIVITMLVLAGCDHQDPASLTPTAAGSGAEAGGAYPVASGVFSPLPDPTALKPAATASALVDARRGFVSRVARQPPGTPVPQPPPSVFQLVRYPTAVGQLPAYLSPDPGQGAKHPAIVWITGGDCNSIGEVWEPAPRDNDQSAAAYRQAGIVMLFPSLRGGNTNPGLHEGFLGEVDDVIAAGRYLAAVPYVDPARIYLGGHSTGGTLVMLVAECTDLFRAVFAFGPADDLRGYPNQFLPFDRANPREFELRSPGRWLADVRSPLFVFEGTKQGNIDSLNAMARASTNPRIQFFPVPGHTHFSVLAPTNERIAAKILSDQGPTCQLAFSKEELSSMGP